MEFTHTHVELAQVAAPILIGMINIQGRLDDAIYDEALNMAERLLREAAERKRQHVLAKPFTAG